MPEFPEQRDDSPYAAMNEPRGAPGGARQHVRSETRQGAVARPGGATQNSGGALAEQRRGCSAHGPGARRRLSARCPTSPPVRAV